MNIRLINYIILFALIANSMLSCKSDNNSIESIYQSKNKKKLTFPTEVELINYYNADSCSFYNNTVKIIHWFNANCSACVSMLKDYQNFINKIQSEYEIEPFFFASTEDKYLLDYMLEKYKINIPVFYDEKNDFFKSNIFDLDKRFHSFILNHENEIAFIGNPILDKKIKKDFEKTIRYLSRNE